MRTFMMTFAVVAAAGLWASAATAGVDFTNSTTRAILLEVEDSVCENTDTSKTHPDLSTGATPGAAEAGCTVFGGDAGSSFADTSNNLQGVLSHIAGDDWNIYVPDGIWQAALVVTVGSSGATEVTGITKSFSLNLNTSTGVIEPASGAGTSYFEATLFAPAGGIDLGISTLPIAADRNYFASTDNSAVTDVGGGDFGVPLSVSCADTVGSDTSVSSGTEDGGGSATGLITDSGETFPTPAFPPGNVGGYAGAFDGAGIFGGTFYVQLADGKIYDIESNTATTIQLAEPVTISASETYTILKAAALLGPPAANAGAGDACDPAGYRTQATELGFEPASGNIDYGATPTYVQALGLAKIELGAVGSGTGGASNAWGPIDWRIDEGTGSEVDADSDLIWDTGDNCLGVTQLGEGMDCDGDADGFGNMCDADFNQNGAVNAGDFSPFFVTDFADGSDGFEPGPEGPVPTPVIGTDMNCNGAVNAGDFSPFFVTYFGTGGVGPSAFCPGEGLFPFPCGP